MDTFIEYQKSHLLGLSGPQPLDSYRLETQIRLGSNQSLSLAMFSPHNHVLLLLVFLSFALEETLKVSLFADRVE